MVGSAEAVTVGVGADDAVALGSGWVTVGVTVGVSLGPIGDGSPVGGRVGVAVSIAGTVAVDVAGGVTLGGAQSAGTRATKICCRLSGLWPRSAVAFHTG